MSFRDLRVLEAAEQFADAVNQLLDKSRRRMIHVAQLRDSAGAIVANIREGIGRRTRGERNRSLRTARGEAEESIGHLRANFAAKRIVPRDYWRLKNRAVTISKMLTSLMDS